MTRLLREEFVREQIIFRRDTAGIADLTSGFTLPQCVGAIDGCFIPIKRPYGPNGAKYWCYKQKDAIILLGVVDARGCFTYVHVGYPGSVGDASTFADTVMHSKMRAGDWFPSQSHVDIHGVRVQPYLIGDAAFTFSKFMMKCYRGNPPSHTARGQFNYNLIRDRRRVENAFARLKGRFAICKKTELHDPEFLSITVQVSCALHNLCTRLNDPTELDWVPIANDPDQINNPDDQPNNVDGAGASVVRNALAQWCDN